MKEGRVSYYGFYHHSSAVRVHALANLMYYALVIMRSRRHCRSGNAAKASSYPRLSGIKIWNQWGGRLPSAA